MTYEVIILGHLHMPLYFIGTFTEYSSLLLGLFVGCGFVLIQPIFSQIVSSKKQAHTIPIKRMKKIS